jgi:hypothetical protein
MNVEAQRVDRGTHARPMTVWVYWLLLRVALSVIVLMASALIPQTALENTVPVWPPSASPGAWLQRVLVDPWLRWDAEYYLEIASRGYSLDDGTALFHPLYPWLGRLAGYILGGNMAAGLLVVSSACGLLFLILFERLARLDLAPDQARRASLYFLHVPIAFALFAPYTESLFLLCSVMVFLMARRGHWWLGGLSVALATLTRQQGIFLSIPLAWELWESSGRDFRTVLRNWRHVSSLAAGPIGLLFWLGYRAVALGDIAFEAHRPATWLYGLFISRSGTEVVPVQGLAPWRAISTAFSNPTPTTVIDLVLGALFLLLLIRGARFLWRVRPSYLLYAVTVIVLSFSFYTGPEKPYMGLPRHCLLAFPLFLPLASWGSSSRRFDLIITVCGLIGVMAGAFVYGAHILWVP